MIATELTEDKLSFLSSAPILASLPREGLAKIAGVARTLTFAAGDLLFEYGDVGESLYIIVTGQVKVFRTNEDGIEVVFTYQGPGTSIGEMALLTGEPRSASVQATEATSVLVIDSHHFHQLLADNPSLAQTFVKVIAGYVRNANLKMEQGTSREAALKDFLSQHHMTAAAHLVGVSRHVTASRDSIKQLAAVDTPALIIGEVGLEDATVAQLIHQASSRKDQALFVIDCATIPSIVPSERPLDAEEQPQLKEISQYCALFGHEGGGFSFTKSLRLGYLEAGHSGTVVLRNVDKLKLSVQKELADFLERGAFRRWGGDTAIQADVRVIATTAIDLAQAVEQAHFDRQLHAQLSPGSVEIAPLRSRKKDLPEYVAHFIVKYNAEYQKQIQGVTLEARNLIMSYDWPGNIEELESVIRRAVNLAQDEMLSAQEMFIGLEPLEGRYRLNLFRFEQIHRIVASRLFPRVLQVAGVAFFALIIVLGLAGSQDPKNNVALVLTWAVWWPLLMFSFLFAARLWCGICPIATIAGGVQKLRTLGLKVPSLLRKYGRYFGIAGFALIVWAEELTTMHVSPRATSILLLSILSAALVCGLLFDRRAWCRYLCPLGAMASVFSTVSVVEFRSNNAVCKTCRDHSCFTGADGIDGCPMYQGPFALQDNEHCVMCGNCVKVCASRSPRINLRPPAAELSREAPHSTQTKLSSQLGLALFVPVLAGTLLLREFGQAASHGLVVQALGTEALALLAELLAFTTGLLLVIWSAATIGIRTPLRAAEKYCLLSISLIPLVFGGEIAYQLSHLLLWAGELMPTLGRQASLPFLERFGVQTTARFARTTQTGALMIGAIISLRVGKRAFGRLAAAPDRIARWALRTLVLALFLAYIVLFSLGPQSLPNL